MIETVVGAGVSGLKCRVPRNTSEVRKMDYTEELPELDRVRRSAGRVMLANTQAHADTIAALRDFDKWYQKDDDRVLLGVVDKKKALNIAAAMESGSRDPDQSFYIGYVAVVCQKHEIGNPHLKHYKQVGRVVVEKNLGLVGSVVKKYRGIEYGSFDEEDVKQAGVFGLMRAVDLFNPNDGYKFPTYAMWWIRRHVLGFIAQYKEQIRVPGTALKAGAVQPKCCDIMSLSNFDDDHIEEVVASKGLTPDTISEHKEQREIMDAVMCLLTPRERCVIERRFGLFGNPVMRLCDIGDQIGLSRERIRQIEIQALDKLKQLMEKNGGWRQG